MATSLRPLLPAASTQSLLNAGNSHSMVLVGLGVEVAQLAEFLRIVDEATPIPVAPPPEERALCLVPLPTPDPGGPRTVYQGSARVKPRVIVW